MKTKDIFIGRIYAVKMPNGGIETLKPIEKLKHGWLCRNPVLRKDRIIRAARSFITEINW